MLCILLGLKTDAVRWMDGCSRPNLSWNARGPIIISFGFNDERIFSPRVLNHQRWIFCIILSENGREAKRSLRPTDLEIENKTDR